MTIIRIEDSREAGYCVPRTKVWFASHKLDFKKFVKSGIDYEEVKHIDDVVVTRCYEKALLREARVPNG